MKTQTTIKIGLHVSEGCFIGCCLPRVPESSPRGSLGNLACPSCARAGPPGRGPRLPPLPTLLAPLLLCCLPARMSHLPQRRLLPAASRALAPLCLLNLGVSSSAPLPSPRHCSPRLLACRLSPSHGWGVPFPPHSTWGPWRPSPRAAGGEGTPAPTLSAIS